MESVGGSAHALSPAAAGGRRSRRHHKLRMVKKKTVRKMLARQGLKMRGGDPDGVVKAAEGAPAAAMGGRRRRSHKRSHRSRGRSLFGLRY